MARLVIVSNRVAISKGRGVAAGGLVVALRDLLTPGSLWFGWSGRLAAYPASRPVEVEAGGITYATVDLTAEDHRGFYVSFANSALWPLLHFRPGLMRFRREDYQTYLSVNRTFARQINLLLQPDDSVWAHDYHLIPFGRLLREQGFAGPTGFFLHVPFVPPPMLEAMPVARELIADLCAYDLVGFQTEDHARHFRDCARLWLGATVHGEWVRLDGHLVRAFANPIGIDAAAFHQTAIRAVGTRQVRRIADSHAGRLLAVGADRMDYSKGLPQRLEAYGRLLERHPEHRRNVRFVQICARSREEVDEYRHLRAELGGLARCLNSRFAEVDWTPLLYSTRAAPRTTLAGLYRMARVGVVTPLSDGMNLVAKEYVAAQPADDPGVLVLSRFAGAARELTEALLVNPFDPDAIADALHRALAMPLSERQQRHAALLRTVMCMTAQSYRQRFLEAFTLTIRSRPHPDFSCDDGGGVDSG
jgi:trehalose 6-phosphate synthase